MAPSSAARSELVLVHSDDYARWLFDAGHPTQGRRFMNARDRLLALAAKSGVTVREIDALLLPSYADLEAVHDREHVERVVGEGRCGEWAGSRPDLGQVALRMAGGTILAVEELLAGRALTAVHFAGAKHHAQRGWSSGFCVFNDFALAAKRAGQAGWRVAILDIDAHHGDGTESLLRDDDRFLTFSIHDRSIFPGTGGEDDPDLHVHNSPLAPGSGDAELSREVRRFIDVAAQFRPDVIFIAMGADGHETDPLSSLRYSIEGMVAAVRAVRQSFAETPVLLGGAGGYQPDDVTPEAWARMAIAAALPGAAGQGGASDPRPTLDEVEGVR